MNPTTTTTTTTTTTSTSSSNSFPSWHDHQHHLGYPNNDDSCFDFMISTQGSSSTDPTSGAVSYNGLVGNARTSSPCMFAEGAPPVFSDYPISISATWCPPCYSTAPTAVPHHHHQQQQQQQQGFYDESSLSSSSISTMPPTPPDDLIPVSISFAADHALSHPYYQHYSTIPVNKVTSNNNTNYRNNNDHSLQSGCDHTKNHSDRTTNTMGKHRKTRRSSDKPKEKKKCSNCGSTKTPTWRRGPITKALLCNACGLYEKVSKKRRVVIVQTDGKTKISRGALNQGGYHHHHDGQEPQEDEETKRSCAHCHTTHAKRWYEQRNYYHCNNNNDTNGKEKSYFICDRCIRTTTSKL